MRTAGWKASFSCAALVFLVLVLLGTDHDQSRAAPTEAPPVATVTTVKPERTTVRRRIELPGQVEASEQTNLEARIAGFVQRVHVDVGDRVRNGQVLAELAVPELEQERKQKQAVVALAEAEVELARRAFESAEAALVVSKAQVQEAEAGCNCARANLARWKAGYERLEKVERAKVIDHQPLDEARHQFEAAKAALGEAEAKVQAVAAAREESAARRAKAQADLTVAEARLQVAKAEMERVDVLLQHAAVRAPFDGVVTLRTANPGEVTGLRSGPRNQPLFTVARIDAVRVHVAVSEEAAVFVRVGMPAVVRFPALQGQEVEGKVTRTAGVFQLDTRTLRTEIDLPNPDGKLRPGMSASVAITVEHTGVWALPTTAVVLHGEQTVCYRVAEGKVIRTPIQVGLRGDRLVEVVKKQTPPRPGEKSVWEDFTGKEEIVSTGAGALKDGQPVRVSPADEPKKEGAPKSAAQDPDDLKALAKARLDAARQAQAMAMKCLQQTKRAGTLMIPVAKPEEVYIWSVRLLKAQHEASGNTEDRVAALEAHLQRMQELQQRSAEMYRNGLVSSLDTSAVEFYRAEAALWLARERAK
jgi:RND family efflux transporter MFP subunit